MLIGLLGWAAARALGEGREVSFWPPRIGPRVNTITNASGVAVQPNTSPNTGSLALPSLTLASAPIAFLRVEAGTGHGTVYFIGEERRTVTIGRSLECDIPILDATLSRTHARINVFPESDATGPKRTYSFQIIDSGSSNGTFLNGHRLSEQTALKHDDLIQVGGIQIRFTRLA
jgi:hypothetical protein